MRSNSLPAALLLALSATGPVTAEGPITPGGVLNTAHDGWSEAVAGENPLTLDEAAATMAFFLRCRDVQNMGDIDAEAFVTDVMAGGLDATGFTEGGAHWERVHGHYSGLQRLRRRRNHGDVRNQSLSARLTRPGRPNRVESATMSKYSAPPPDTRPGWGRFAGIAALYALLGPLVGAIGAVGLLVLIASVTGLAAGRPGPSGEAVWSGFLITLVAGLPMAYSFGLVSSSAVGVAVALRDRRRGGISWRMALGAAAVLWIFMSALATLVISGDSFLTWLVTLLAAHVLAAMVCTWVARRLFGLGAVMTRMPQIFRYRPASLSGEVELCLDGSKLVITGDGTLDLAEVDSAFLEMRTFGDARMVRLDLFRGTARQSLGFNASRVGYAENPDAREHWAAVAAILRALAEVQPGAEVTMGPSRGPNLAMFGIGLFAVIAGGAIGAGAVVNGRAAAAAPAVLLLLIGLALVIALWPWAPRRRRRAADLAAEMEPDAETADIT